MTSVASSSLEYLVDLFLEDDPCLTNTLKKSSTFSAEGEVELESDDDHDGEVMDDDGVAANGNRQIDPHDQYLLRIKTGRELRSMGDDMNDMFKEKNHKTLPGATADLFSNQQKQDEDTLWLGYKNLIDQAVNDIAPDNTMKMVAVVLLSVKGLSHLGSGLRSYALRYMAEKNLDADFKRLSQRKTHPDLD